MTTIHSSEPIVDTSAEGIALALCRLGIVGAVFIQDARAERIELTHEETRYQIHVFASSDSAHRAALFSARFGIPVQHWEAQA